MARELTIIQEEIIEQLKSNNITVSGSRTSIRRIWTYVVAFCIWTLEKLFDTHVEEVKRIIETQKPHRLQWYQDMALRFQYGTSVLDLETGQYDNTGLNEHEIEERRIIKVASVTEIDGKLRIKVAKLGGDNHLTSLTLTELEAFANYIDKIKDAGVKIFKESNSPDSLKLSLEIFYNPLILTAEGARLDGNDNNPIQKTINQYLQNLPFNGEYANTRLIDALQKVEGVELIVIKSAQAKYGQYPFSSIDERYIPDAGYLRIATGARAVTETDSNTGYRVTEGDLTIKFRPYV